VRSLDRAVVDFTAPRCSCEMMITVVITLDPRKNLRGPTPVELETRQAEGAGHFKNGAYRTNRNTILPCSRDPESMRPFQCFVLEIWPRCQTVRQLSILPANIEMRSPCCAFAIWKITNLKTQIEKIIVSNKYVLLRNAVHMPKEDRLRTRYRTVTPASP
jgi:hypothetical protein